MNKIELIIFILIAAVLTNIGCSSDILMPELPKPEEPDHQFILDDIYISVTNKYGCGWECKEAAYLEFAIQYHFKGRTGSISKYFFDPQLINIGRIGLILNRSEIKVSPDTLIEYSNDLWFLDKIENVDSCYMEYSIEGRFWEEITQESTAVYDTFTYTGTKLVYIANDL